VFGGGFTRFLSSMLSGELIYFSVVSPKKTVRDTTKTVISDGENPIRAVFKPLGQSIVDFHGS